MTLYQFNLLPERDQYEAAWGGTFLVDRLEGNKKYIVYVVDAFYVEVRYDAQENAVESIRAFSSTVPLEPYLSVIDISGAISHLG